ncbi:GNAT family N-acetyltransferase [Shewanella colwelliana]|uniref:GNAT family N-acetyltransferase n=1 Tax=Shewanella colwelliana TaxID=23 RepID=UPI00299CF255|nr:GNAT family N-acetyltransferase [Shewanella colwelliana]MDX1281290.1 GNAT family N-acetyltransferase [Shewanella colwelliana]
MLELYTDRLKIRSLQRADWQVFLSIHQDPELNQFIRRPDSVEAIGDKFEARLLPWLFDSGDWLTLTIEEIDTGNIIGFTGLYASNVDLGHAEVGYMLSQAGQGQGYATESLAAVIDWASLSHQVHKFIGLCATENRASVRVLEKCGFQLEGVLRHNYRIDDRWIDDCCFGLLTHERAL